MARIPRLVSGAPSISLTADELALMDAIDGVRDEEELARYVKRSAEDVADHLERLALLGAVAFDERVRAEIIDLDPTTRQHFDRIFELLGQADHYELLGVARDADKKAIKAAYHRLGPAFHPDRHFRKSLGPYKQKIEAIFAGVTRAHDTLRYPKKREDYDAKAPERPGTKQRREAIQSAVDALAPADRKGQEVLSSPPPMASAAPPSLSAPRSSPPRTSSPPTRPPVPPPRMPQPSSPTISEKPSSAPPGALDAPRRRSFPGIPVTHMDPEASMDGRYRRATPPSMRSSSSPPDSPHPQSPHPLSPQPRKSDPPSSAPRRSDPGVPPSLSEPASSPRHSEPSSDPGYALPPNPSSRLEETPERKDALARKLRARAGVAFEPPPVEAQSRQRPEGTYQDAGKVRKSAAEVVRDRFQLLGDEVRRRRLQRYLDQGRIAMAAGDFRAASAAYEQAQKLAPDDSDIAEKTAEALRRALEKH